MADTRRLTVLCALALAGALLQGCAPPPQPTPDAPKAPAPEGFPGARYEAGFAASGTVYRVDPARSGLQIRIDPAGSLAHLGHHHLVTGPVHGYVFLARELPESRAHLYAPVDALVVDDPEARAAAGEEFAEPVPAEDAEATRANMMGGQVLEASRYPFVQVTVLGVSGAPPQVELDLRLELHGSQRRLSAPARVRLSGDSLTAEGSFSVEQSAFGITPFSTLMGALKVRDRVTVGYRLVAIR